MIVGIQIYWHYPYNTLTPITLNAFFSENAVLYYPPLRKVERAVLRTALVTLALIKKYLLSWLSL